MQTDLSIVTLEGSGLQRDPRVPARKRLPDYADRFDATTLWYDVIWRDGAVWIVAPRPNNLARSLRHAVFDLDGRRVRPRIRTYYRHAILRLDAPTPPARLRLEMAGWSTETAVNRAQPDLFAGRNTLLTLSKDNDLDWIEDWVRFHAHHHGADAVLFLDNGSARYGAQEIEEAIRRGGVSRCLVQRVPLPFGPRGIKPFANTELFLQTSLLNVARLRYLSEARALLYCDLDELVGCRGGTIFDHAVASRFGFVSFEGWWVHRPNEAKGRPCHADHSLRDTPPGMCPHKWCIVPSGPMRGFQWRTHELERLPLPRLFDDKRAWFWHLNGLTTGWKRSEDQSQTDRVPDADLVQAMRDAGLTARHSPD